VEGWPGGKVVGSGLIEWTVGLWTVDCVSDFQKHLFSAVCCHVQLLEPVTRDTETDQILRAEAGNVRLS
jgi:hypothetical protein